MKLILLGPPGSGKGTQSRLLCEKLGLPQISTGDILREARQRRTALGKKTEGYITQGQLVPDALMLALMEERLNQKDCQAGYILDGFPRTVAQAKEFDDRLEHRGETLNAVINFLVPHEELVKRLTGRRQCKGCGAGYHLEYAPPQRRGVCDRCGGVLFQRDDDKAETIEKRLAIYQDQTSPLTGVYERAGLLKNIIGVGGSELIFRKILHEIGLS